MPDTLPSSRTHEPETDVYRETSLFASSELDEGRVSKNSINDDLDAVLMQNNALACAEPEQEGMDHMMVNRRSSFGSFDGGEKSIVSECPVMKQEQDDAARKIQKQYRKKLEAQKNG